jgi:hypothetical protein
VFFSYGLRRHAAIIILSAIILSDIMEIMTAVTKEDLESKRQLRSVKGSLAMERKIV